MKNNEEYSEQGAMNDIAAYRDKFPNAQDPEEFMEKFGPSGLQNIIRESKGKEIVFKYLKPHESDELGYTFK